MKVLLHLREGVTPARFMTGLGKAIRGGEHKAWEVVKARPLTIRHLGRFKSVVTLKPAPARRPGGDHKPPDVVATMVGKDAGFVLRYFAGLVAMKLGGGRRLLRSARGNLRFSEEEGRRPRPEAERRRRPGSDVQLESAPSPKARVMVRTTSSGRRSRSLHVT